MARKKTSAREIIAETREEIVDEMLRKMEEGGLSWINDLEGHLGAKNYKTQASYRGANRMRLAIAAARHGWNDNRFLTFRQAKELGLHVREGERGTMIEICKEVPLNKKDKDDEANGEPTEFVVMPVAFAHVFNMEQIEGDYTPSDEVSDRAHVDDDLQPIAQKALAASPCPVNVSAVVGTAFYEHGSDIIGIYPQEAASTLNGWTRVLLHEESHATGNAKRLNRDGGKSMRSKKYAIEELVAEISAAFLAAELGLPKATRLEGVERDHADNHAAYVGSWLAALSNDKGLFFRAVGSAQKAADYIARAWRPAQATA